MVSIYSSFKEIGLFGMPVCLNPKERRGARESGPRVEDLGFGIWPVGIHGLPV